jgi:transposase
MPAPIKNRSSASAFDPKKTVVMVVEMSRSYWFVAGLLPRVERRPLEKLQPDADAGLALANRWRPEGGGLIE